MRTRQIAGIAFIAIVVIGLVLLGLAQAQKPASSKLAVTATFYPLYDFAKNIGGDKVEVTNITPAGSEPHDYEATPRQLASAQASAVFMYNGATFEPWVGKFLSDYTHTAVKASEGITLQSGDPHFWLDPVLAQKVVDTIEAGLAQADPSDAGYFSQRAATYKAQLAQLDADFKAGLQNCQTRTIITAHAAFGYMGARYNLNVLPIAGISPDEEPSTAKLAELSQLAAQQHLKYVFLESLASPKLADTIATETGAQTLVLDPIEGLTDEAQKQGKDYLSLQRENLANLRTALACQ